MKTKSQTKNPLMMVKAPAKNSLTAVLNEALAHAIDLKLQAKQAHWNVKGENFIAVHELLDKVAAAADEYVDLIAERVMQLGGMAQGTLQTVTKISSLPAYPTNIQDSQQHLSAIGAAISRVSQQTRDLIETADTHNDAVTADICTEITRGLDQLHWFVVSHLIH